MPARLIDLYWRRAMARRYIPRFVYYFHLDMKPCFESAAQSSPRRFVVKS